MSEKRFKSTIDEETMSIMPYLVSDNEKECFYNLEDCVDLLNEQQDTINKLREILAEAEDMIEVRLAEHYIKEYENIKHHIIGDNDEREAI